MSEVMEVNEKSVDERVKAIRAAVIEKPKVVTRGEVTPGQFFFHPPGEPVFMALNMNGSIAQATGKKFLCVDVGGGLYWTGPEAECVLVSGFKQEVKNG